MEKEVYEMQKTIEVVFENGVFKPLQRVDDLEGSIKTLPKLKF